MSATSEKLSFVNQDGVTLAGRLELPDRTPRAFALFAHCFTCSKDVSAAGRISRALARQGIAVLRFDFTGLGGSDGEFENSNFTSNVEDLLAAARHLSQQYQAPRLLIGHSLGGAAVLVAARRLPSVEAVVTIGAPADPAHVRNLFADEVDDIERDGVAAVNIGQRPFRIRKQFLDDLEQHNLGEELGALNKALLIFHSPVDKIVGIDNARRIYEAARGFKSFVSLADADHLLLKKEDAEYTATVLSAWAGRYLGGEEQEEETPAAAEGFVQVEELQRPFTARITAGRHSMLADEPAAVGGADRGPTPYDYLLAGLGACTSMTLRMYADRKKWPLDGIQVRLRHARIHAKDCESCESTEGMVDTIERELVLTGDLDQEQQNRLLEISEKCPVHRTLLNEKQIPTRIVDA